MENKVSFDELSYLENVLESLQGIARVSILDTVSYKAHSFPIFSIELGSKDSKAPTLAIFGGVHGLERIGSDVAISVLENFGEALKWDKTMQERLSKSRILVVPIVNPVGMFLKRRANGQNVDLMRNAPIAATSKTPFLLGGQTYSQHLPWYRGHASSLQDMEIESRAMCRVMLERVMCSDLSIAVDVHSGFGIRDQLWFPYAKSTQPFAHLSEVVKMKELLDATYPNHIYKIEPQSLNYTTHGDLWDYLLEITQHTSLCLPWTLELGSWTWLKKNPTQLFSSLGAFNPVKPHRFKRTLRRHLALFDFLHRCLLSPESWVSKNESERALNHEFGKLLFYGRQ